MFGLHWSVGWADMSDGTWSHTAITVICHLHHNYGFMFPLGSCDSIYLSAPLRVIPPLGIPFPCYSSLSLAFLTCLAPTPPPLFLFSLFSLFLPAS